LVSSVLPRPATPQSSPLSLHDALPISLTAVFAGITEPLEFIFIFIAPFLFLIHAVLGATMVTIMHAFGLVGNLGGGLIKIAATKDRKSTRLNSSHVSISYAVFCLKKKT